MAIIIYGTSDCHLNVRAEAGGALLKEHYHPSLRSKAPLVERYVQLDGNDLARISIRITVQDKIVITIPVTQSIASFCIGQDQLTIGIAYRPETRDITIQITEDKSSIAKSAVFLFRDTETLTEAGVLRPKEQQAAQARLAIEGTEHLRSSSEAVGDIPAPDQNIQDPPPGQQQAMIPFEGAVPQFQEMKRLFEQQDRELAASARQLFQDADEQRRLLARLGVQLPPVQRPPHMDPLGQADENSNGKVA